MDIFSEEVFIRQQSTHIRNKVSEIVEINSGYTNEARTEIDNLLSKIKYSTEIIVSKNGKLDYGEKLEYRISICHNRKLPFSKIPQEVIFNITGEYYNANY